MKRAGRWILASCVIGSVMWMGAIDVWVLAIAGTLLSVGVFLVPPRSMRPEAMTLIVVAVGLVGVTTAQSIPTLGGHSPHTMAVWKAVSQGANTITLSRPETCAEILRGCTYLSALVLSVRLATRVNDIRFLERMIVLSAVALGVTALVHQWTGAHAVYGLYHPKSRDVTIIAPLLNVNQLSGYLTIGVCVAFGSLISNNPIASRVLLGVVALTLLTGIVWLGSRGAVASVGVGIAVTFVLARISQASTTGTLRATLPMFVMVAGVGMFALAASPTAKQELADTDVSKLHMQFHALKSMAYTYPWFGCGRGAFESAFAEFRIGKGHFVWTHPENIVVQWVSEWGIPISVVAFGAVAWALRPAIILSRPSPPIGPYAALVALTLHNLVDFSSEIPAVMIALVVCAGIVVGGKLEESRKRSHIERWMSHPHSMAITCAVMTFGSIVVALPARAHDLTDQRLALQRMSTDPRVSNEDFFAALSEETRQHPAEPYFPYLGAARTLLYVPEGDVIPWINRTLDRAPVYPPAHLLLARWLRTRNPNQALLEYRLGAEQNGQQVGAEAESLVRSFEDALELAPEGKTGNDVLESLSEHISLRLPATRWRIDQELILRDPNASFPRIRFARDLAVDVEQEAPWCTSDCTKLALDAARDAQAHSDVCEPHLLEAKLRGADDAALDALSSAADRVADRAECLRALGSLAIAKKSDARATDAIQKLTNASCSNELDCVQNITNAAALEDQRGHRAQAMLLYKRAAEQAPERDDITELVASRARAAGLHAFAADAYGRLSIRHPENASYAQLAKEEAAAARSMHP